jgi:hypothetical protein
MRRKLLNKVDRRTAFSAVSFFAEVSSEESARALIWKMKLKDQGFKCSCGSSKYWALKCEAEVKECCVCGKQHRLRAGTMFEHSKLSLLLWCRAIYFVMQDKRGISALQLKRLLGLSSYQTAWSMLLRIRRALGLRDEQYQLKGSVELDGAYFINDPQKLKQKHYSGNKKNVVLVAVEQKRWVDERGKVKMRAGFAKVRVTQNTREKHEAIPFVGRNIRPGSRLVTDGKFAAGFAAYPTDAKSVSGNAELVASHLPWVHKFISNSKRWILGTHHGRIGPKYLQYYLAEYTFRFNRRHDPNSLFSRALAACTEAQPLKLPALCG